jgi:hypothetical protein
MSIAMSGGLMAVGAGSVITTFAEDDNSEWVQEVTPSPTEGTQPSSTPRLAMCSIVSLLRRPTEKLKASGVFGRSDPRYTFPRLSHLLCYAQHQQLRVSLSLCLSLTEAPAGDPKQDVLKFPTTTSTGLTMGLGDTLLTVGTASKVSVHMVGPSPAPKSKARAPLPRTVFTSFTSGS